MGTTWFSAISTKEDNFRDFLFGSLEDDVCGALPKRLLLKERIPEEQVISSESNHPLLPS